MTKVNEAIKCGTELTLDVYTTFKTHGRTFKVVLFNDNFCSIEDKYITNGRLNTPLYMSTLRPSISLEALIRQTDVDCRNLKKATKSNIFQHLSTCNLHTRCSMMYHDEMIKNAPPVRVAVGFLPLHFLPLLTHRTEHFCMKGGCRYDGKTETVL